MSVWLSILTLQPVVLPCTFMTFPFAHAMTKRMLHQEWAMPVDEAIEAEAHAQAICMETNDFRRAYEALSATPRRRPVFQGD